MKIFFAVVVMVALELGTTAAEDRATIVSDDPIHFAKGISSVARPV